MTLFQRIACTAAVVLLLAWGTTAFAPPFGRPPPRPGPPAAGGRMGSGRPNPASTGGRRTGAPEGGFRSWGRTPRQIETDLRGLLLPKAPGRVIPRLAGQEGQALPQTTRVTLAREVVEKMAVQAEISKKPVDNLAEVRSVRSAASKLPADVQEGLARVAQGLERRVLVEGLQEIGIQAERNQWREVVKKARAGLAELGDARLARDTEHDSAEFRVRLPEVRKLLGESGDLAERMAGLDDARIALKRLDRAKPEQAARSLALLDRARLPAEVRRQVDSLRGLAELDIAFARKWTTAPDVAGLKQSVARFEGGADGILGKKLLQELSVKAALEGYPAEALKLLPEGGPPQHAANLLRDIRALALGEGQVQTAPALAALDQPGKGADSPRAPPGLEPLIPLGARHGWRPPVKEKPGSDLPPLKQAREAGATVQAKVEKTLPARRLDLDRTATQLRNKITVLCSRVMAPELAERRKLAAVENELDRRLRPLERVRARALLAQNRPIRQIATDLQAQAGDDEEAEFLADVEKRLGKPLAPADRLQAKRLRKQGRTAAETADILRP
jgi:hypothetical protein